MTKFVITTAFFVLSHSLSKVLILYCFQYRKDSDYPSNSNLFMDVLIYLILYMFKCFYKESATSTAWVTYFIAFLYIKYFNHIIYYGPRSENCPNSPLNVLPKNSSNAIPFMSSEVSYNSTLLNSSKISKKLSLEFLFYLLNQKAVCRICFLNFIKQMLDVINFTIVR